VIVLMTDGRPNGFPGDYTNASMRVNPGTCDPASNPLIGVMHQWAGGPLASGTTAGLMPATSTSVNGNDGSTAANATGCNMAGGNLTAMSQDLSKMPTTDIHSNSTTGPYSVNNPYSPYNSTSVNVNNISIPRWIEVASANALDNQGTVIRSNNTLKPQVYTILLEGNAGAKRPNGSDSVAEAGHEPTMQNDTDSVVRTFWGQQTAQTKGYFVDAPDPSQLCAAFNSIATQS